MEIQDVLGGFSLLQGLSPGDLAAVAAIATRERHADDHTIFNPGDEADAFYVVERGSVSVIRDGREIAVVETGQGFGEAPLFTPGRRLLEARSSGGAQLVCVRYEPLRRLLDERPEVAAAFYRSACADVFARLRRMAGDGAGLT